MAGVEPPRHDPADVDEAVFDVVERIPPGRVSTYGAIGRLVGVGQRRVARAMSSGGGAVPWWRVLRADGTPAEPVRVRQLEMLAAALEIALHNQREVAQVVQTFDPRAVVRERVCGP